jgi:hypothetical protein
MKCECGHGSRVVKRFVGLLYLPISAECFLKESTFRDGSSAFRRLLAVQNRHPGFLASPAGVW